MSERWGQIYTDGRVMCGDCDHPAQVEVRGGTVYVTCRSLQCPHEGEEIALDSWDESTALCPDCNREMAITSVPGLWSCPKCHGMWSYEDGEFEAAWTGK